MSSFRRPNSRIATLTLAVWALLGLARPAVAQNGFFTEALEPAFFELPGNLETLRLENGLQVVLMRNPAQPMVGVYVQVKVGSAVEDFRTSGMSHMLEHLLFNGSEEFSQEELYALADRAGAYNNAHTTDFYTDYMMVLPADQLETGLHIQSQMLLHSLIPEDKFEKEKGIVVGELVSARDRPGYGTTTLLRETLYAGSSLELPTLGTRSTIEHMQRDDVYAFYKQWYVPNNMVLTVAGNFRRDEVLPLLESYYGQAPPGSLPASEFRHPPHIQRTETRIRRGGGSRLVALAFEAPGFATPDVHAFEVMVGLLNAPGTGILSRALEDIEYERRPQLDVSWERGADFGRLVLRFDLNEGVDPEQCYRLVQEATAAALEFGITGEEVRDYVATRETETLLEREQLRMTGIYIADPLVLGGVDFFAAYLARLREVNADEVAQVIASYLVDSPCLALLVEAAVGGVDGAEADAAMDSPAGVLPVERTVLESGTVVLSQTNPDSRLMAVHLTARGRAAVDAEYGEAGAVNLVHRLLTAGVSGCDEPCQARRVRQLGAKVKLVDNPDYPMDNYYTNGRFSFVRVEVGAENGLAMLELLTEVAEHASFDQSDFERERAAQIDLLEGRRSSSRQSAQRALATTLYGNHPLAQPPEGDPSSLAALTYDQARTTYRKAFSPDNLVISIISPYSHEQLVRQLAILLPGRGTPTAGLPPLPLTESAQRVVETMAGQMAAIRLASIRPIVPEDAQALELLVAILSDRMAMDLREARGLSYSVGASVEVHGEQAQLIAWLNPPRERAVEGEEALLSFVQDFSAASIDQDELDTVRAARRGRTMMRRLSSISQAYYLAMAELDGDVGAYLAAIAGYDEVTLDDLRRVAQSYLTDIPLVTVVVD